VGSARPRQQPQQHAVPLQLPRHDDVDRLGLARVRHRLGRRRQRHDAHRRRHADALHLPPPSVAASWTHQLSAAASQRPALWVVGVDNSAPFPLDLVNLLGLGTSTCLLHFNPINAIGFTTVGGGPGTGSASFAWQLPPTGGYAGLSLFTQWVVFDPLGPSASLATTGGLWSIVAPFGG